MDGLGEDLEVMALKLCLFLEIEADGERGYPAAISLFFSQLPKISPPPGWGLGSAHF